MVRKFLQYSSKELLWYNKDHKYDPIETEENICSNLNSADKSPKTTFLKENKTYCLRLLNFVEHILQKRSIAGSATADVTVWDTIIG